MSDRHRTLTELERNDWGRPTEGSRLVSECHRLRHIPLSQLTVEDLRLLIGQHIGLEHVVPLAIERLQQDPFAEGAFFPGDLLKAVVSVPADFWSTHSSMMQDVQNILDELERRHRLVEQEILPTWRKTFGGV